MKEHYLVTGATGFVGANLVRNLILQKKLVSIIVRNKDLNWRLYDIISKLDVHVVDLTDPKLSDILWKIQPTIIYHLATYGTVLKEDAVNTMIDVNIKGTLNLIRAAKRTHFKLFVNTGSSSEYGVKTLPMCETDVLAPINDYGVSKAAVSLFCQKIAQTENLPIVTFRLFSPYGPFESKERFVPTVISYMLANKPLELSSPVFVRDFVFVQDVVDAYLTAIDQKIPYGTILNIGSGKQHALVDVVNLVRGYTNSTSHVIWNNRNLQLRQIEPASWQANMKLTKEILHWAPKYSLESGIGKTIQWMKEHKNLYT